MKDNPHPQPVGLLTRDQMQAEAVTIDALLSAAMAVLNSTDPEDTFTLVEMAQSRAKALNHALDDLHRLEETA